MSGNLTVSDGTQVVTLTGRAAAIVAELVRHHVQVSAMRAGSVEAHFALGSERVSLHLNDRLGETNEPRHPVVRAL